MASLSLKNDAAPSAFTPSAQPEFGKKLAKKSAKPAAKKMRPVKAAKPAAKKLEKAKATKRKTAR